MAKRTDPLSILEKAETVAFGGVGFAGEVLPPTRAYFDLAERLGPDLRPDLERLLDRATPAGKVYAADLLDRLDRDAGRAAWRKLSTDTSAVSTFSGCLMGRTTLADYAAARLD